MKQTLLKTTLLFLITILFTNCDQELINDDSKNQALTYETELILQTKDWFTQSKNNLKILDFTKTIDWEHAIVSNGNNGYIIETPLILNDDYLVTYNKNSTLKSFYRFIFVKDEANQYELYTLIISTDDDSFDNNSSNFNYYSLQDNFNGFTVILNSKNELDALNKYKNGEKLTNPKNSSFFAKEPVFCTYLGYYICDTNNVCRFEPLWLVGCFDGGGETAPNSDYHSTGGGSFPSSFSINLTDSDKIDPNEELKCFDLSKNAKLTIYVQQPRENTNDIVGPNSVGHAFIGIEQGGIVRQLGFYPESGANSAMVAVGVNYDSELRENNDYLYHVSLSKLINSSQLNTIINYIKNFPNTYNVNSFACADFAIKIGNLGGMNLPSTTVSSYTYSGRSPGQLGQEIRAMNSNSTITVTKTSGNSPNSQGTCN